MMYSRGAYLHVFVVVLFFASMIRSSGCICSTSEDCPSGSYCTDVAPGVRICLIGEDPSKTTSSVASTTEGNVITNFTTPSVVNSTSMAQNSTDAGNMNTTQRVTTEPSINETTLTKGITTVTTGLPTTTRARVRDACDPEYEYPRAGESQCQIPCGYGICVTDGVSFHCVCDPGAEPPMCIERCCKSCQNGGKCVNDLNDTQTCQCKSRYLTNNQRILQHEGEYCENYIHPDLCDPLYNSSSATEVPLTLRQCGENLTCVHGICNTTSLGDAFCTCNPGAHGLDCGYICCLDCGHQGECAIDESKGGEICICKDSFSGQFCEVAPPLQTEKPNWYWWVVGTCIFVLVLLLVLLVVVPYVMWKHRVILIMKVVHYFQGYEDDDEREWDAFISYKGNTPDEDFVVRTLFPKLAREMGFNINVHFKDFVPGEEITHGIINAIENSRRTIMVVSPHYLTSSWTKFEWQMAQQKMLEKKHRIIPILFDDISQQETSMDTNLKLILNSVTYIEWPRSGTPKQIDKFWKRIELSMPKMRCRQMSPTNQNGHVSQNNKANGEPIFTRSPDSIDLGISGNYSNQTSITELSSSGKSDYNTINEIEMLGEEEVYDTLNEREMEPGQFSGRDVEKGKDDGDHYDKLEAGPLRGGKIETLETKPDFRANDGTIANEMKAKEHEYLNILNVRL